VGELSLTLLEPENVDVLLDRAIENGRPAPYGVVTWPSALAAARTLDRAGLPPRARVVDVGAGTGVVSLWVARCGGQAIALDVDDETGALVRAAAALNHVEVDVRTFDLVGPSPLPPGDVVVFADVLYEPDLAAAVARRTVEALAAGAVVIVADPGRIGRAGYCRLLAERGVRVDFVDEEIDLDGRCVVVGVATLARRASAAGAPS
jgi:predicted nicotinamide N-methyase